MKHFNQFFEFLAKKGNVSLNLDILETGLLNFLILIGILVFAGKDFLDPLLKERKANIVKNLQNAEDRLAQSKTRLYNVNKQLTQISSILNEIKTETVAAKKVLLESEISETKKTLKFYFGRALETFKLEEKQIFLDIKQQILLLVLHKVINKTIYTFNKEDIATRLIDETILKLEGDLL